MQRLMSVALIGLAVLVALPHADTTAQDGRTPIVPNNYADVELLHEFAAEPSLNFDWSPDSQWLAYSSWYLIHIWDTLAWTQIATLEGHNDIIYDVQFSPDGIWLASGSSDGTVRLWNTSNWRAENIYEIAEYGVSTLAWSADSAWLLTSDLNGVVSLIDPAQDAPVQQIQTDMTETPSQIGWSPTENRFAFNPSIFSFAVWDVETQAILFTKEQDGWSVLFAWSPDGSQIAEASYDSTIRLWNVEDGSLDKELVGHTAPAYNLVWTSDGATLISAGEDSAVWLWTPTEGDSLEFATRGAMRYHDVVLSPDDVTLAITRHWTGIIELWEVGNDMMFPYIDTHADDALQMHWSPDGTLLAVTVLGHRLTIWGVAE